MDDVNDRLINSAVKRLKGSERRMYQAEVCCELCESQPRRAERRFGWCRNAVGKGLEELTQKEAGKEVATIVGRPRLGPWGGGEIGLKLAGHLRTWLSATATGLEVLVNGRNQPCPTEAPLALWKATFRTLASKRTAGTQAILFMCPKRRSIFSLRSSTSAGQKIREADPRRMAFFITLAHCHCILERRRFLTASAL